MTAQETTDISRTGRHSTGPTLATAVICSTESRPLKCALDGARPELSGFKSHDRDRRIRSTRTKDSSIQRVQYET
ncbi:hypothetical protein MHYP_G00139590 [Metynnis hypsauchen]